jgi:hypothetical protein
MKTCIKFFILSCIVFFTSCETNNQLNTNLKGKWIESVQRKDTLLFKDSNSFGFLTLYSGLELRGGYMLPKLSSGQYGYKLDNDSIMVNPLVSNSIMHEHYYFKLNSTFDILQIGNFYDSSLPASTIMTFVRIN